MLDSHAASNMLHYFTIIQPNDGQPDIQTDIAVGHEQRVFLTEEQKLENSRLAVIKCRSKNKAPKKTPMTSAERQKKYNMNKAVEKALARTDEESLNNLINKP